MKMDGEYRIPAPQQTVWEALNDPEILQQSVPGCESIEKTGENELQGVVRVKVGPVKARFKGKVTLTNIEPPTSCTMNGEGTGGAAGFAKGAAHVTLSRESEETVLHYVVEANVGGKLAQIGQRFIDSTAKKLSDEFFANFSRILGDGAVEPQPAISAADEEEEAETARPAGA